MGRSAGPGTLLVSDNAWGCGVVVGRDTLEPYRACILLSLPLQFGCWAA